MTRATPVLQGKLEKWEPLVYKGSREPWELRDLLVQLVSQVIQVVKVTRGSLVRLGLKGLQLAHPEPLTLWVNLVVLYLLVPPLLPLKDPQDHPSPLPLNILRVPRPRANQTARLA